MFLEVNGCFYRPLNIQSLSVVTSFCLVLLIEFSVHTFLIQFYKDCQ